MTFSNDFSGIQAVRNHFRTSIADNVPTVLATLVNEPEKPVRVILVGMVPFKGLLAVPLEGEPESHFFIDVNDRSSNSWSFRHRTEKTPRGFLPVNEMSISVQDDVWKKAQRALAVHLLAEDRRNLQAEQAQAAEDRVRESLENIVDAALEQSHGGYYNSANLKAEYITAADIDSMIGELQKTKRLIEARDELKSN